MSYRLTCTALAGTNKTGKIKADAQGYYPMCIGAFDVPNSVGDVYVYDSAVKLFESSTLMLRRAGGGFLKGEYGHPKKEPGMSIKEYIQRNHEIYEPLVSHVFREIWIDKENIRDANGSTIIAVMADLKPTGPYGEYLAKQIESDENVAFSIRCFCEDKLNRSGRTDRHIRNIITWDCVTEPGLAPANKHGSPACESASIILVNEDVSMDVLNGIMDEVKNMAVSHESASLSLRVEETIRGMGRDLRDARDLQAAFRATPKSYNW